MRHNGFPFEIKITKPNDDTVLAMQEARELPNKPDTIVYHNVDEMMHDIQQ